ncbi:MAG: histone deacetylase family protein [Arenicellales bacterium]|nr:histone deacetylase family protein [Arenicellales bacterium]
MLTIYTDNHVLRNAKTELAGGQLIQTFEQPARATRIVERIKKVSLGDVLEPNDFGLEPIFRVHDKKFVRFLETAWEAWSETGYKGEGIPMCWPARRMSTKIPDHINGKMGYYAMASETSFSPGTWEAAFAAVNVALTGAELVNAGESAVFALCRPPGHHAARDMFGGYCFLNNAAIAAQYFIDHGKSRVAVLDVDFHHGNGTQDIFYDRNDVMYLSLHGDPRDAFPYFLGYADETGKGGGEGYNFNYPMKPGTAFDEWVEALNDALQNIRTFGPDILIVSLGVDTFETDPISFFKLKSDDFLTYGASIARLKLPTLFVMEGGYDINEIGRNTVNVLQGFESG